MNQKEITRLIAQSLGEDGVKKDITSIAVFGNGGGHRIGYLIAKGPLVLSGMDVARQVFREVSPSTRFVGCYEDGAHVERNARIARVQGFVSDLLRAERVALNFLQYLSGVATLTYKFVQRVKPYRCRILDTRKTHPGLRMLEKKAVRDGGGTNHRMNLSDEYLIKDNHIAVCGGIREAIRRVKEVAGRRPIEVEARHLREVKQALEERVDIILLDNMKLSQIRKAVKLAHGKCLLEVSGGVNLRNVRKIAQTGVSRISIGALTHSAPAVDISFKIE